MKNKPTIGIIGFGRFGTLTAAILAKKFDVKIYHYRHKDENDKKAKKLGVKLCDLKKTANSQIVILAVPISKTKETIKKVSSLMPKGSMLIDTCSVKTLPCKWLEQYTPKHISILGTHPMFGPVTTKFDIEKKSWDLKDKQIILCPLSRTKNIKKIKDHLEKLGIKVIVTTPKDHDEQNAKTLSFVHFIGRSFMLSNIKEQKIFTPGYTDLLKILPHTNQDDWQLFYDMHNYNPYSKKIRDNFLRACALIEDKIIKSNSTDNFDFQRKLINKIDDQILSLIQKRLQCSKAIGKIKKEKGLKIIDTKREKEIIDKQQKNRKLNKNFIKNFYKLLFEESYKEQK